MTSCMLAVAGDRLPAAPSPALNERDVEVLRLLADGRSTAGIAVAMAITPNTVRTRIRRVQRKLDVIPRDQVVHRARDLGVI
jgi:two-component system response regulator DesR